MEKQGYTVFTGPLKHGPKGSKAVQKAQKQGQDVQYYSKQQHPNKHMLDARKVAQNLNDEEDHKPPQIPHQLKLAISQARNAKGLTQQQLAHQLSMPKADINSWENGKSLPTGNVIAKMDRILGVKLPRPPKN